MNRRESDDVSIHAQLAQLPSPIGQFTSGGCQMRSRGRIYVAFSHSNNKQGLLCSNLTMFSLRLIFAVVYC